MVQRIPLGSPIAADLAKNPAASIGAAAVSGVALTAAAAYCIYKKYEAYQEKQHKKAMEVVNSLHAKFLEKIPVHDSHDIKGFPAIFVFNPAGVDSLHLTDEQIEDIGARLSQGSECLSTYMQAVRSAILALKGFYLSRSKKDRHDITSGVLAYLLQMICTKCLYFQGYSYDIAYLGAITRFINAYASLENTEKSVRFDHLDDVRAHLLRAKQILEKQKENLSLRDSVAVLRDECVEIVEELIRRFGQLFVSEKAWPHIKYAAMEQLREGVVRRKYIRSAFKGFVIRNDPLLTLDESIFKKWVTTLADYYIESLKSDATLLSVISPNELFKLPDFEKLRAFKLKKGKLTQSELKERHQMKRDEQALVDFFRKHRHFLTTKLDPKTRHKKHKMIPVTEPEEMHDRAHIMAVLGLVIHKLISLQYFCMQLLNSIEQLGELYVKDPNHFRRVFSTLDLLCREIKENVIVCKEMLTRAQQSDMNTMQLEEHEILPERIKELLDISSETISKLGANIKAYRKRVEQRVRPNEPTQDSVIKTMCHVTDLLDHMYGFTHDSVVLEEDVEAVRMDPPFNMRAQPLGDLERIFSDLTDMTTDHQLSLALTHLKRKAEMLASEKNKSPARQEKADNINALTLSVFQKIQAYLGLNPEEKAAQAEDFMMDICGELNNKWIDVHHHPTSRVIHGMFGKFQTDTRHACSALLEACEHVIKSYRRTPSVTA